MREEAILQQFIADKLEARGLRKTKIDAVISMTNSLINGAELTVTSLGAFMEGHANVKHKIKRVDRFLNNDGLYKQLHQGYGAIFENFLITRGVLDIIVDWSGCCNWEESCIRAAIVCDGRAITIYQEIHENKKQQKPEIHKEFLKNLHAIIPRDCRVTIITDRGFQTKWFQEVRRIGWDFIGRASQSYCYQINNSQNWHSIKDLYDNVKAVPEFNGEGFLGKNCSVPAYFHTFKELPKNRKNKKTRNKPNYPEMIKMYKEQYKTPWVIVTSHAPESRNSGQIIKNYKTRMQIEETFRDDKSERFGYGFRFGRTHSVKRLSILLFIAALCSFILMIIGAAAEEKKIHRSFQSNSIKNKRVLSLITLAKRVIRHCINEISKTELIAGLRVLAKGPQLCVI